MHQECQGRGWRDGSTVESTCCSSRNPKVCFSDPGQQLTSITPFTGVPQASTDTACTWCIDWHTVAKAFLTHKSTGLKVLKKVGVAKHHIALQSLRTSEAETKGKQIRSKPLGAH